MFSGSEGGEVISDACFVCALIFLFSTNYVENVPLKLKNNEPKLPYVHHT